MTNVRHIRVSGRRKISADILDIGIGQALFISMFKVFACLVSVSFQTVCLV